MFSRNMQAIYKRFLILGLLSMCLFVFEYSDKVESVGATAICIQQCESSEARCNDSCATACSADMADADCNSCVQNCNNQFQSCARFAIYCNNPGPLYSPNCGVDYGLHCPLVAGEFNCNSPYSHTGYFLTCNTIGGNQCISCPGEELCSNPGGLPPYF